MSINFKNQDQRHDQDQRYSVWSISNILPEDVEELLRRTISSEVIEYICLYKHPLFKHQITQFYLNHKFVVLKTRSWYWSLETDMNGITLQRSKHLERVRDYIGSEERNKDIVECNRAPVQCTDRFLPHWSKKSQHLKSPYHWRLSNCKHFANEIFELSNHYR